MVFSSILFLFRFMPAAFAVYYLVPIRFKNFTLLVLSLIFYSWGIGKVFSHHDRIHSGGLHGLRPDRIPPGQ